MKSINQLKKLFPEDRDNTCNKQDELLEKICNKYVVKKAIEKVIIKHANDNIMITFKNFFSTFNDFINHFNLTITQYQYLETKLTPLIQPQQMLISNT